MRRDVRRSDLKDPKHEFVAEWGASGTQQDTAFFTGGAELDEPVDTTTASFLELNVAESFTSPNASESTPNNSAEPMSTEVALLRPHCVDAH